MIKNQLYPYIEKYINEYLYGFTKEQLDIAILNGSLKLERINLRPDKINSIMDEQNVPFWLKAGLISKISVEASLLNFIGELPLEIEINGIDIIMTPSYKWIIKNINNYVDESADQLKAPYDHKINNGMNILKKKAAVFDDSIFKKKKTLEIFKDKSKISEILNNLFKGLFKFYYMSNFAVNVKIKNIHFRFEDDQLINYNGDIAFGMKIGEIQITLGSAGASKKDSFKLSDMNFYVENNAKILINSSLLNNSLKGGQLNESYYKNLKKIHFENFQYRPDTRFILQNFNCYGNFGTKLASKANYDIFTHKQNAYKVYFQFASGEINLNIFPELLSLSSNFTQFLSEFKILEQVKDFKPLRKPYDKENANFKIFNQNLENLRNDVMTNQFEHKRKMIVKDWIKYFYWCKKSKDSLVESGMNPLTLEFARFYSLCFGNNQEEQKDPAKKTETKEETPKGEQEEKEEVINPDNIKISLSVELLLKEIKINLHPTISSIDNDYSCFKLTGPEIRIFLEDQKFDVNFSIKHISLAPNRLIVAEKVLLGSQYNKKKALINKSQATGTKNFTVIQEENLALDITEINKEDDIESNTGLNGLLKKYRPNIGKKLEKIMVSLESAKEKNLRSRSRLTCNPYGLGNKGGNYMSNYLTNQPEANKFKCAKNFIPLPEQNKFISKSKKNMMESNTPTPYEPCSQDAFDMSRYSNMTKSTFRSNNFVKKIVSNCEGNLNAQKREINREKIDFNLSKSINDFNNKKNLSKVGDMTLPLPSTGTNKLKTSNAFGTSTRNLGKSQIILTGESEELNLLDIYGDDFTQPALKIKYQKVNYDISNIPYGKEIITDAVNVQAGTIRLNLLAEYVADTLTVLKHYQVKTNKAQVKQIKNYISGLKLYKYLLNMKKYILQYIEKLPSNMITDQISLYTDYLKNEIAKGKLLESQAEGYEINYFFSLLPTGIEIFVDYENIECVNYDADNKISGKAQMPPLGLLLKLSNEKVSFRFFDCVFELDDIRGVKKIMEHILKIAEEKLKGINKIFIDPCLVDLKAEMNSGKLYGKRPEKFGANIIADNFIYNPKADNTKQNSQHTQSNINEDSKITDKYRADSFKGNSGNAKGEQPKNTKENPIIKKKVLSINATAREK